MPSLTITTIAGIPYIRKGDDLAAIIIEGLTHQGQKLDDGDILVIAQKVVSKAEGACVHIDEVTASDQAIQLAKKVNKDPRKVEVILSESKRLVKVHKHPNANEGIIITEHNLGHISANAAVDESNTDTPGELILLPKDPDASAKRIASALSDHYQCRIGIVISDTFGRPWRLGQTNVAIGLANIPALNLLEGELDAYGRPLKVTAPALADELAGASGLLMSKKGKCAVILFKGLEWACQPDSQASDLLRPTKEDLFA